jgi:Spy/CpxP family protein refolding chaperone
VSARVKPWLFLGLIFLIGIITGGCLTLAAGPWLSPPPGLKQMRNHWVQHLSQRLMLTSDQREKIRPIVTEATAQIQAIRRDEIDRVAQIMQTANDRIVPLLTPEQKTELEKMQKDDRRLFPPRPHPGPPGSMGGADDSPGPRPPPGPSSPGAQAPPP